MATNPESTPGSADPWRIDPPPGFKVCLDCTWIHGPWQDGEVTRVQRCDCRKPDGGSDETWPRYDSNLHGELCRCCGRILRRSGHRFSVWFCEACRLRVIAFDRKLGATVIPIGRHTVMAGIGVRADEDDVDAAAERIHHEMRGLFDAMNHLEAWRDREVARRLVLIGATEDLPVSRYLAELDRLAAVGDESLDPENAFAALCRYFLEE